MSLPHENGGIEVFRRISTAKMEQHLSFCEILPECPSMAQFASSGLFDEATAQRLSLGSQLDNLFL